MAPPAVLFSHGSSLEHDTGEHPERRERIVAVMAELERLDWLGYERVQSPAVSRDVLQRVHPEAYIEAIEQLSADGGGFLDADTVISRGSFQAALHGAGGAVALVERLLAAGPGAVGFSAHRPPGHHALPRRPMGFCLFNNIAVAARHALATGDVERVLIVDWDVHHGNGTNDVFHDAADVLFTSIHQWPLYPGTGPGSDVGAGVGRGYTINLPVPSRSGDAVFVSLVRDVIVPVARAYRPGLILVSAGFDAHEGDPLAGCRVSDAGFGAMATLLRDLASELEAPIGAVMEGGYALEPLARGVALTMDVLRGGGEDLYGVRSAIDVLLSPGGGAAGGAPEALAPEARARLREFWPVLA
ncbi:MAG TPA: histone deacetylase [Solirubrobacteraceae bacterium]|nr:histone deacetylase [Solirubrobacteraceae bacterium]